MDEFEIEIIQRRVGAQDVYSLETEYGILDATVDRRRYTFGVANLAVEQEYRRQGIAA